MAAIRLGLACVVALLWSACGHVKADWGFEETVDSDVGEGSSRADTDGDAGTVPLDPCSDPDAGACDPLTNAGCDGAAGYACSFYAGSGGPLACLADSTEPAGAPCDAEDGPWCGPTLTCAPGAGVCTPFCCGDDGCTGAEPCTPLDLPSIEGALGYCAPPAPDAGASN
jgi:hypothetical protein